MKRRALLKAALVAGIGLALPWPALGQSPDSNPTPEPSTPQPEGLPTILKHRVNVSDRATAALNTKMSGYNVGASGSINIVNIPGIPHYFGPYANYANSPAPLGRITSLTLDSGGSGYPADTVVTITDAWGTGSGATATIVNTSGILSNLVLMNAGANYSAPIVSFTSVLNAGVGTGAAATALIGGVAGSLSGGIRKFIDSLPGLNVAGQSTRNQYIPIAVANTSAFPGSDYYEIELGEYTQQLHRDLPATKLRGYRQTNGTDNTFHYLGPLIVARRGVPVRIKFTNNLPVLAGGNLFLPVDTTIMGAGMGPLPSHADPLMKEFYTQNRATLHLHGGLTPWISDGTPHQWTTPATETTQYPRGVSVVNVPDMNAGEPGPGKMTFYYTNAQSARLMFYHDHAMGITRLNVYAGEAAGYLLTDNVETDLISGTNVTGVNPGLVKILPDIGIPLIIQDKTFVDPATIPSQDPMWKWNLTSGLPTKGSLWVPNVYMPAQNPWDPTGASAFGRWQYGPWFWPPTANIDFGPVPNEYYGTAPWEPPMRPAMPTPSMGMESYNDTTLVNGEAYPYLELEPRVYRFRILNAANDRFYNLHFYRADPSVVTTDGRMNTEVRMVPAIATANFPPLWPGDGRAGGVPDPTMVGPSWIHIGTEGGFLPAPVVVPPQPVAWNLNPLAFNVGNVTDHSLLLGAAVRADVLVDFSQYAGQTLILYNDAPAAFPAIDPRYDYYTGSPDLTSSGGAPTIQAGFGPNTRTVMQVRIKAAGGAVGDPVSSISVVSGGADFQTMPLVELTGGAGAGATATATGSLDHITVLNVGSGYDATTTVTFTGGGGTGAAATANLSSGRVVSVTITNPGTGYTSAPVVGIVGIGAGATAAAALYVSAVVLGAPGSGYTSAPAVSFLGGGGYGAIALAHLSTGTGYNLATLEGIWAKTASKRGVFEVSQDRIIVPQEAYNSAYNETMPADSTQWVQQHDWTKSFFNGPLTGLTLTAGGTGYTSPLFVTITGGGGSGATASATRTGGKITGLTLLTPGTGFTSAPTVTITGAAGSGATAVANGFTIPLEPKAAHDEMGAAYDLGYGRMGGLLGLELRVVNSLTQALVLYPYISPPVEVVKNSVTPLMTVGDGTQLWKFTHNGVDTHPIHVHLFNVQVINRVAWDGALLPPDPSELGWKETVLMNPLEHLIVALRPQMPALPFPIPNSVRLIDPTQPAGVTLRGGPTGFQDPAGVGVTVTNHKVNFGCEYVVHCHILSHEEMDMMHSMAFATQPAAPNKPTLSVKLRDVTVTWNDIMNASHYSIERATKLAGPWVVISANVPPPVIRGTPVQYVDKNLRPGTYFYRVTAINTVGDTTVFAGSLGFPTLTLSSGISLPANPVPSLPTDSGTTIPSDGIQVFDWFFAPFTAK